MKIFKLLFLVMISTTYIFSQQYLGDNKIVVNGESTTIVESNRAAFTFSVLGFGETLKEAIESARSKIKTASNIFAKYKIPGKNISTSVFESGENFGGKAFLSSSKDFRTLMSMNVIVENLEDLENIIVEMSELGIENISNISYSLKDIVNYKKQVKIDAMLDAKNKAEIIAKQFDLKLGKVIYVEDNGFRQNYPNPFNPSSREISEIASVTNSLYSKPVKIYQKIKVIYSIN